MEDRSGGIEHRSLPRPVLSRLLGQLTTTIRLRYDVRRRCTGKLRSINSVPAGCFLLCLRPESGVSCRACLSARVSVSPSASISPKLHVVFTSFGVHVTYGRGSVFLWRRCDRYSLPRVLLRLYGCRHVYSGVDSRRLMLRMPMRADSVKTKFRAVISTKAKSKMGRWQATRRCLTRLHAGR